jgi:D-alanine-D-alanine ligase
MKKAVLLINAISSPDPAGDELDVLVQADAVEKSLDLLGWQHRRVYCDLDLEGIRRNLEQDLPGLVFNLVESLGGKGALIHLPAWLLESLGIPFTGSPARPLTITTDKVWTKQLLREHGIPTPEWFLIRSDDQRKSILPDPGKKYILKPVLEDGSAGITDSSVVEGNTFDPENYASDPSFRECFLEEYIDGREFNITLLEGSGGVQVMPAAEMLYLDYPEGKPRILNYASKWEPGSFEYEKTIRNFDLSPDDDGLIGHLNRISLRCWDIFGLKGYARVDFRIDRQGNPFVLEVNANPCISPDAGFTAACDRGGIDYTGMIRQIMESVLK